MHLVIYHVTELEEVGHTDRSGLVKLLTRTTVEEIGLTIAGEPSLIRPSVHIIERSTVEDRRSELAVETTASPSKDSLEDLTEVHSRRHTEGVQTEINRRTICEEGHILLADDLRDDTLVTVTTCHLITDLDLTLLSDVDLSHLDDTRGQFITHGLVELLTTEIRLVFLRLLEVVGDHLRDELIRVLVARPPREDDLVVVQSLELGAGELSTLANLLNTEEILHAVLTGLA